MLCQKFIKHKLQKYYKLQHNLENVKFQRKCQNIFPNIFEEKLKKSFDYSNLHIYPHHKSNSLFDNPLYCLFQWFPNFFGSRTTYKNLVVREGQNIDLHGESWTTSAILADHRGVDFGNHWSI
jgi:hypothetical protein